MNAAAILTASLLILALTLGLRLASCAAPLGNCDRSRVVCVQ